MAGEASIPPSPSSSSSSAQTMATPEDSVLEKTSLGNEAYDLGAELDQRWKSTWSEVDSRWNATVSSIHGRLPKWAVQAIESPAARRLRQISGKFMPRSRRRSIPIRSTSYLDGLRGFAAVMVYILHHQLWAHEYLPHGARSDQIFENGFGYNRQFYFVTLPFVRTFFSGGHLAVALFFVISGYVLSAKPLALLHANDHVKLGDNVASALFRRWMRLYIPIITTTFIYMTANYLIRGLSARRTEARYFDEMGKWYQELKDFSWVYRMGGEPWFTYNFHVWTIPLEFKGSLVVYTGLIAFSRCTRNARLWCQLGLMYYFIYIIDGWYCALFVAGMFICDLDLLAEEGELPRFLYLFEPWQKYIWNTFFVVGLYLGGVPANSADIEVIRQNPGWYYLSFLRPDAVFLPKQFYLFWAGVFLFLAVQKLPWLKRFFELPYNIHLGRISYSFYLLHGPILWTIGDRVYAAVGWSRASHAMNVGGWTNKFPLPKWGPLGLEFSFLAAQLVLFPLTLWLARLGTAIFDEPSLTISRWCYKQVTKPATEPAPWSEPAERRDAELPK